MRGLSGRVSACSTKGVHCTFRQRPPCILSWSGLNSTASTHPINENDPTMMKYLLAPHCNPALLCAIRPRVHSRHICNVATSAVWRQVQYGHMCNMAPNSMLSPRKYAYVEMSCDVMAILHGRPCCTVSCIARVAILARWPYCMDGHTVRVSKLHGRPHCTGGQIARWPAVLHGWPNCAS